jgi:hypothetical protein
MRVCDVHPTSTLGQQLEIFRSNAMTQPASQQGAKLDMRTAMPLTAEQVADWRKRFGAAHVNACIKAAMQGERNRFYAIEAGHFLGTPFDWTVDGAVAVSMSMLTGAKFIAGLLDPKGVVDLCVREAPRTV